MMKLRKLSRRRRRRRPRRNRLSRRRLQGVGFFKDLLTKRVHEETEEDEKGASSAQEA